MDWRKLKPNISKKGLFIDNKSIVETWEESIQEEMARRICKSKKSFVLEIGYGLGFAAKELSKLKPKKHIIIEAHPVIFSKALNEISLDTNLLFGYWESHISILRDNLFNGIIFDAYPMTALPFTGGAEETLKQINPFLKDGYRILKKGGTIAFLDFSNETLLLRKGLSRIKMFSKVSQIFVPISPNQECSYSKLKVASIILLTK